MATDLSPASTNSSPTAFTQESRSRRSSSRASAMSAMFESARTLCPRDGDAFSFAAGHLPAWSLSQDLWQRLPGQLQSSLAAMQHAGAAVLTGFERVERHSVDATRGRDSVIQDDDIAIALEDGIPIMPTLPLLVRGDSVTTCSSIFTSFRSSASASASTSPSPPHSPLSEISTPVSPMALAPLDKNMSSASRRTINRERSFSTPLEPHDAYYVTELSQLRTESLPRLRHAIRKVDTNWVEVKRSGTLSPDEINEFENWLAEKKCNALALDSKGKALSEAAGLTSNGIGWTAP